jgi:type II secretory pathway pseudopilin PulG
MINYVPQRRGMTMIEILFGLAMTAILVVALGTAFKASASSLASNDDRLQAMKTARTVLQGITDMVRRSDSCDVGSGADPGASTSTTNVLYVTPVDLSGNVGATYAYVYDSGAGELLLDQAPPNPPIDAAAIAGIRGRLGTSVASVAQGITNMTFRGEYAMRPTATLGVPENRLVNAQVTIQVPIGQPKPGQTLADLPQFELRESVVPRRAYQQH